jgi:hypothetical protein
MYRFPALVVDMLKKACENGATSCRARLLPKTSFFSKPLVMMPRRILGRGAVDR